MDEMMQQLESYIEDRKTSGVGLPSRIWEKAPHFRAVSAASGINLKYLIQEPYRQRVLLAAEEIGLTPTGPEAAFFQNRAKLENYFQWLKENTFKLPEDPKHRGTVFFAQVTVEVGLEPNLLAAPRKIEGGWSYQIRLRQLVEQAVAEIGLEVRVLPFSPGHEQIPFTYKLVLDRGTEERKKELEGHSSPEAQLYNTRYAFNLYLRILKLKKTDPIGPEFVMGFEDSVKKVIAEISNTNSRKKFNREIRWWQENYQRLLKGPAIPDDFRQALVHLVDRSGLSFSVLAKLIGVSFSTLERWYEGRETPSLLSAKALESLESLFKVPAGTLVNKITGIHYRARFRRSELPPFLQQKPKLYVKVSKHLPDNFCTLTLEAQGAIVEWIQTEILRGGDDKYAQRLVTLRGFPYQLKEWPSQVHEEFETFASFKMAENPPHGMRRIGSWKPVSKRKHQVDFSCLFGAICLPTDAGDVRLRGLGFPKSQLTLGLIICPEIIKWYTAFRCEVRNQYTEYPIGLLQHYISMLRPGTGWLRQCPQLASQLLPFADGNTHYVSQDMVTRAQADWDGVCDDAIKEYQDLIEKIKKLATVARDPFHRIEGILAFKDPMKALGILIEEMKRDLPNPHTQPVLYHIAIRDLVITILFVVTGFRRGMLPKLDYTGDKRGDLYFENGHYVLSVPRTFFKNPDSSYFQTNCVKEDYLMELPNIFGLNEIFREYLEISRPFLIEWYYDQISEQPLFITAQKPLAASSEPTSPRLRDQSASRVYEKKVEKYLVENKHRGTGLPGVKKTGPHSVRHIRGTTVVRKTGSFKLAGDANQHSERTARKHYSRVTTKERNQKVSQILF